MVKKPGMQKKSRWTSPQVKIYVTENEINEGVQSSSSHCMIAESVKRSVPKAKKVAVDMLTIRWTDPERGLRYTYLTPRTVARAIIHFDQGIKPEPFSFQLRTAQQIRPILNDNAARKRTRDRVKQERLAASPATAPARSKPASKKQPVHMHNRATVIGGPPVPQMSTRREFGARLFLR